MQPSIEQALLLAQIVHPVAELDLQGAIPELRQESFGKVKLQCTMLTHPFKGSPLLPTGVFPTFCAEADMLRVVWLATDINVISNAVGRFQGHVAPTKVSILEGGKPRLEGQVNQLGTITAEEIDLNTEGLEGNSGDVPTVSEDTVKRSKVSGPPPVYPALAREKGISGTVLIDAVIGEDGRVHAPTVTSSPDGLLSLSSLIAVQQWVYKPVVLKGVRTAVRTTLGINFALNRR